MSVALLSGDKNVEISDELEAFFYVLLYHAIRYLWSNLSDVTVATYLDEFFNGYSGVNETYCCSVMKLGAIQTGKLTVAGYLELTFYKPMDDLVVTLLRWFQAKYTVSRHSRQLEDEERQQKLAQAQMPPPPPPLDDPASPTVPEHFGPSIELNDEEKRLFADVIKNMGRANEPTKQEQDDAKRVQKHVFVYRLLDRFVRKTQWPAKDKMGDRIPKTWVRTPLGSTVPLATKSATSNKKARMECSD